MCFEKVSGLNGNCGSFDWFASQKRCFLSSGDAVAGRDKFVAEAGRAYYIRGNQYTTASPLRVLASPRPRLLPSYATRAPSTNHRGQSLIALTSTAHATQRACVYGCRQPGAFNYNPAAVLDDPVGSGLGSSHNYWNFAFANVYRNTKHA